MNKKLFIFVLLIIPLITIGELYADIVEEVYTTSDVYTSSEQGEQGLIAILISPTIYQSKDLEPSIEQYVKDLEKEGYRVIKARVSTDKDYPAYCHQLREYLKKKYSEGLKGCLFVGHIPTAWFEIRDEIGDRGATDFPIDLFYMDLDGKWEDNAKIEWKDDGGEWIDGAGGNGIYDKHVGGDEYGDIEPEIWIGRLEASRLEVLSKNEAALLKNYFRKNHDYRMGKYSSGDSPLIERRGLVYLDDEQSERSSSWVWSDDNPAKPDVYDFRVINDKRTTNASDYKDRLKKDNNEWIHLNCHSSPKSHSFRIPGTEEEYPYEDLSDEDWERGYEEVSWEDVKELDPKGLFYYLDTCGACQYSAEDCIGNHYTFANTYGLATIGHTKTSSTTRLEDFYDPLSQGKNIGDVFKDYFNDLLDDSSIDKKRYLGLTLLGDPTLRISKFMTYKPKIGYSPKEINFIIGGGSTLYQRRTLSISNTGTGILEWEVSSDADWLSFDQSSGKTSSGEVSKVTVSADSKRLTQATITITAKDVDNSPQTIPVIPAHITVISPNSGEEIWKVGSSPTIEWKPSGIRNDEFWIELYWYESGWHKIAKKGKYPSYSYRWEDWEEVPNILNKNCRIYVGGYSKDGKWIVDCCDKPFIIAPRNSPPTLNPIGNKKINEGGVLEFKVTGSDLDGDPLEFSIEGKPSSAEFKPDDSEPNTWVFKWQPITIDAREYPVLFKVSDDKLLDDSEEITITVIDSKSPFIILTSPKGGEVWKAGIKQTITWDASRINNNEFWITYYYNGKWTNYIKIKEKCPSHSGEWVPDTDISTKNCRIYVGGYGSKGWVSDTSGAFTITPANSPPVLYAMNDIEVNEGKELRCMVFGSDPDDPAGNSLSYSATNLPKGAIFDKTTRLLTWKPDNKQVGVHKIGFTVSDGELTDSKYLVITVKNINFKPTLYLGGRNNIEINEGEFVQFTVYGSDPDEDKLTYSVTGLPERAKFEPASFDPSAQFFSWRPTYEQAGRYTIRFTVSDDGKLTDSKEVTIIVKDVQLAPATITIISPEEEEKWKAGSPQTIKWHASSIKNDGYWVEIRREPSYLYLNTSVSYRRSYSWHVPDWASGFPLTITVYGYDIEGGGRIEDSCKVILVSSDSVEEAPPRGDSTSSPRDVNHPPKANAGINQIVNERSADGSPTTVTLDGSGSSDPDGDEIRAYSWTSREGITLLNSNTKQPTFEAPEVTEDTPYTFILVVKDDALSSDPADVTITVKDVDQEAAREEAVEEEAAQEEEAEAVEEAPAEEEAEAVPVEEEVEAEEVLADEEAAQEEEAEAVEEAVEEEVEGEVVEEEAIEEEAAEEAAEETPSEEVVPVEEEVEAEEALAEEEAAQEEEAVAEEVVEEEIEGEVVEEEVVGEEAAEEEVAREGETEAVEEAPAEEEAEAAPVEEAAEEEAAVEESPAEEVTEAEEVEEAAKEKAPGEEGAVTEEVVKEEVTPEEETVVEEVAEEEAEREEETPVTEPITTKEPLVSEEITVETKEPEKTSETKAEEAVEAPKEIIPITIIERAPSSEFKAIFAEDEAEAERLKEEAKKKVEKMEQLKKEEARKKVEQEKRLKKEEAEAKEVLVEEEFEEEEAFFTEPIDREETPVGEEETEKILKIEITSEEVPLNEYKKKIEECIAHAKECTELSQSYKERAKGALNEEDKQKYLEDAKLWDSLSQEFIRDADIYRENMRRMKEIIKRKAGKEENVDTSKPRPLQGRNGSLLPRGGVNQEK